MTTMPTSEATAMMPLYGNSPSRAIAAARRSRSVIKTWAPMKAASPRIMTVRPIRLSLAHRAAEGGSRGGVFHVKQFLGVKTGAMDAMDTAKFTADGGADTVRTCAVPMDGRRRRDRDRRWTRKPACAGSMTAGDARRQAPGAAFVASSQPLAILRDAVRASRGQLPRMSRAKDKTIAETHGFLPPRRPFG